jgi:hypothetical protein
MLITTVDSLYTRGLYISNVAIHKGKSISVQSYYRPSGTQEVETPRFWDILAYDAVPQPNAPPRAPKAVPVRVWRFQDVDVLKFHNNRHMKVVKFVSSTHRLSLPPRIYFWYSFPLEAEWTSGPFRGRKYYVNGQFQCSVENRTRNTPACSAVSQATGLPCIP